MSRSSTLRSEAGAPEGRAGAWTAGAVEAFERTLEARHGVDWRVIVAAVALLVGFEGWVRSMAVERLAFGGGNAREFARSGMSAVLRDGTMTYDVGLVGSSRTEYGFDCEEVERTVEAVLGRAVTVRNFGMPHARNDEFEMIVEALLRGKKPGLLVVGLEPRAFLARDSTNLELHFAPAERLWELALDRRTGRSVSWERAADASLGELSRAYLFRDRFAVALLNAGRALGAGDVGGALAEASLREQELPVTGGLVWDHLRSPDRSLVGQRDIETRTRAYVVSRYGGEHRYEVQEEGRAPLYGLLRRCAEAGVEVVFVETPAADVLRRNWNEGTAEGFAAELDRLEEAGARVLRAGDLGVELGEEDYRDGSHVNLRGARRFSAAVAERVIAPTLGRDSGSH